MLSPWHKAYQKRTLSIGSEILENHHQRAIGMSIFDHSYPLALRPDPTSNHKSHGGSLSSMSETCDTAGYLELIIDPNHKRIQDNYYDNLQINTIIYWF